MSWWYEHPAELKEMLKPFEEMRTLLIRQFVTEKGYIQHTDENGVTVSGFPDHIQKKYVDLTSRWLSIITDYDNTHEALICIKCKQTIPASHSGRCMNIGECPDAPPWIGG
jgi:hypothetical protein